MPYGGITVIAGSMFSGKTEELIRLCRRAQIAKQRVAVFKPSLDTRTGADTTSTHSNQEFPATVIPADNPRALLELALGMDLVGIEEAQFFQEGIVQVCEDLARQGAKVIVAGLDLDFRGRPFGPMPQLLAIADHVCKLTAICTVCGRDATRTQRLSGTGDLVEIGAGEKYAARCPEHHTV